MSSDVVTVFDYWVSLHSSSRGKKPVLSDDRRKKISSALDSHGLETVLQAVAGCAKSDFHMGDNDRGTRYNDISLILRNSSMIEKFAAMAVDGSSTVLEAPQEDWVQRLVDRAFATWNVDPSRARRHATWEAWRAVLKDLDSSECERALTDLAVRGSDFMPRPADVRRLVLRDRLTAPSPLEAWGTVQFLNRCVSSGTLVDVVPHECVLTAMRRVGGVQQLHTNGDREMFCAVYEQVVAEFEQEVLAVR